MNNLNAFESLTLWMAGYDRKTAELCTSSEIRKMSIAGTMVLIPPLVGLFSYGYAFYFIFKHLAAAIIGGILAATVLLLLDRSIMAYGRPGSLSLGMLGRVLLALTVGFMLAEPIILKVFEDSIAERQHSELISAQELAAIPYEEEIETIKNSLKEDRGRLYELQAAYTMEMDGKGSDLGVGQGPVYTKKLNDYLEFKDAYDQQMAEANARISAIEVRKGQRLEAVAASQATGLIGRMRALHQLGQNEPIVEATTWLLRIFFVLIELIPLLIKISPAGDRGLYYKLVDILDQEKENVVSGLSTERQQVLIKEDQLRYVMQYAELSRREQAVLLNAKSKDTLHLMDKVLSMAEQKIDFQHKAAKTIRDEALLGHVYRQIDAIFDDFLQRVDPLHAQPKDAYSPEKV